MRLPPPVLEGGRATPAPPAVAGVEGASRGPAGAPAGRGVDEPVEGSGDLGIADATVSIAPPELEGLMTTPPGVPGFTRGSGEPLAGLDAPVTEPDREGVGSLDIVDPQWGVCIGHTLNLLTIIVADILADIRMNRMPMPAD
jgi:hypothetical protein